MSGKGAAGKRRVDGVTIVRSADGTFGWTLPGDGRAGPLVRLEPPKTEREREARSRSLAAIESVLRRKFETAGGDRSRADEALAEKH